MLKRPKSIYANKTVIIATGETINIEDYWENVNGRSWKIVKGNHSVGIYKKRIKKNMLPDDDEVLYGKIGSIGIIIHASEVKEVIGEWGIDEQSSIDGKAYKRSRCKVYAG